MSPDRSNDSRTLFLVAALCLAIGLVIGRLGHQGAGRWQDLADGVQGVCVGLALGLQVLWLRRSGSRDSDRAAG